METFTHKSKIAILTTVSNFELYSLTSNHFPKGIKKYVIDGRNGMHGIHSIYYMFKKLKGKNIDWLILADEDIVFKDSDIVFSIIQEMKKEHIVICGVRDGGIIEHRKYNPHMVNTFFVVLDFKEISKEWNKKDVKRNQYILPFEFKIDESKLRGQFDVNSLYEPYYCFFLWLKRKGKKFLYLDAQMLGDAISNSVLFEEREFAFHTWYARSYKINDKHTKRIDKILKNVNLGSSNFEPETVVYKDKTFHIRMKFKKAYNRVLNKIKHN